MDTANLNIPKRLRALLNPGSYDHIFYDYAEASYITEVNCRLNSRFNLGLLERSFHFLLDNSYFKKQCHFTFSGNPLMHIKELEKFIRYAEEVCKGNKKIISFHIIAQELPLSREVKRFFNHAQVSLTYYLSSRYLAKKTKKFLAALGFNPKIVIQCAKRTNIIKLCDFFVQQGWRNLSFQLPVILSDKDLRYYKDSYKGLARWYLERLKEGILFNVCEFSEVFFRPHAKHFKCTYGLNALTISPSGEIIACPCLKDKELSMGNILEGEFIKLEQARFFCSAEEKLLCRNCRLRQLCAGGCNLHTYCNTGSLTAISKAHCALYRQIINLSIFLISKIEAMDKNIPGKLLNLLERSSFRNCYA